MCKCRCLSTLKATKCLPLVVTKQRYCGKQTLAICSRYACFDLLLTLLFLEPLLATCPLRSCPHFVALCCVVTLEAGFVQKLEGHGDEIFGCAFNYEGDTIITGSKDNTCRYVQCRVFCVLVLLVTVRFVASSCGFCRLWLHALLRHVLVHGGVTYRAAVRWIQT